MLFHQLEDNLWCTKRRKQFGHFCEHNLALSSFLWLNMSIVAEQHCLTINVCSSLFQQHCSALMKHQRFNVPSTVQYSTVQHSTVQYSTVQYSTVQCSTAQYSTKSCFFVFKHTPKMYHPS